MIRPILSYAPETRADTKKKLSKKINNIEVRVLKTILGLTLKDRQTNCRVVESSTDRYQYNVDDKKHLSTPITKQKIIKLQIKTKY
ncbi:hypothetical protein M0802_006539 [Mischocyttarus mexicanus]|nr:hypothetical protein M0802_006539 [Mischocyttarus mexicanus]